MKPLAIDLFCGLGGWTEGLLAEGYRVVGFDNEQHVYGEAKYPAQLVLQDVLTIHGSQFKDADLIVASPPCQAYSYRAMPWKRAKALPPPDNTLFEACFRIQREACEAAGHHIPLVVENVCGAQKWVGRAKWHFGSFYLWGDVPALMPITRKHVKVNGFRFDGSGRSFQTAAVEGLDAEHLSREVSVADSLSSRSGMVESGLFLDGDCLPKEGHHRHRITAEQGSLRATKNNGGSWFAVAHNTTSGKGRNPDGRGVKVSGDWFGSYAEQKAAGTISPGRLHGKRSKARKAASAQIAKIPHELARHIARAWKPLQEQRA